MRKHFRHKVVHMCTGEYGYTDTYMSLIDFFIANIKCNNDDLVKLEMYNCDIDITVIIMP